MTGFYPWHASVRRAMRRFYWLPRLTVDAFGNVNLRWGWRLRTIWRRP